ncbi:MAG: hypothetical protein ABS85_04055 [Sphingobacteriales bacterium SCN 48-20]|jgi:YVTN family beta-propeller protein|nr:MAG: hypothetical protein ABS85_04055 [Sphingobacteriales bacterium SCN 48-20]OJW43032.1 MAG: hypothetical protein BGO56_13480 [Sphingobacteriales bacterium 48-107]
MNNAKYMKKKNLLPWTLALMVLAASCSKDDVNPGGPVLSPAQGVYVLSEGSSNNATLGYYSLSSNTLTGNFYQQQNPTQAGLGSIGNDMTIYGSKLYIVVNVSSDVVVVNAATGTFIKRIAFKEGSTNKEPRYAIGAKGKVFVSCYDGTVAVIDTTSLNITTNIPVGTNPEEMALSGDNLYVANSGGLNFPNYDSTLSVVNVNSLTEITKIKVGINPQSVTADDQGFVYVSCTGNYGSVPAKLVKVKISDRTIAKSADTAAGRIRYYDNKLWVTGGYIGSPYVRTLSTADFSQTRANFVTDGTAIAMPYGLDIDKQNGDVYVTDARDYVSSGQLLCFDKTGKKKFAVNTTPGVIPTKVAFNR